MTTYLLALGSFVFSVAAVVTTGVDLSSTTNVVLLFVAAFCIGATVASLSTSFVWRAIFRDFSQTIRSVQKDEEP